MPLHIHRAERADALVDALAEILARPMADPFTAEVVAVPGKGMERWLAQRLSHALGVSGAGRGDGIAANISFVQPAALVTEVVSAVGGVRPEDDPWAPRRLVWTMMAVLDEVVTRPWAAVPARHLGVGGSADGEHRIGRRYATAAHLCDLFDGYAAQRPALLVDWAREDRDDTDVAGGAEPAADAVPPDLAWQPRLWRHLRAAVGAPSPAERLSTVCERLRERPDLAALPPRLSVFAPTRVPADQLAVLTALATAREIHLWLVHPSPAMWSAVAALPVPTRRTEDTSVSTLRHPLLSALGRDLRELQHRISGPATTDERIPPHAPTTGDSLLGRVQAGLREDVWPPERGAADDSVQIHACHGPARQVEVLREVLVGLFAADPTLEPRDVLVLCPEVESYAPLVLAAFGARTHEAAEVGAEVGHPARNLRVRTADRGRAVTNPLLAVIATLLELADGRVTVTQVLDLAATDPVRRRCGFDDDAVERLREWAAESGARWGIGQRQRQAFGLADFGQNTLNAAVDRILLGVTADESADDWLDLVLPLDDIDSNDVDLAGRFAEFVDRLAVCLRDLRGPRPARDWAAVLARALDLLTEVSPSQGWIRAEAGRELATALEHAGDTALRLSDVGVLLAGRLAARPARANFRTGELTVCGLAAMRSVPHRVVVLLGLDDEVFPRTGAVDGDDLTVRDPLPGERDIRAEDRQSLLDAVTAAREKLLVFHTGADPITGAYRPPAVPVAELLDVLRAHVGDDLADVLTRHPLQAYDRRNFLAARPISFDADAFAGARAAQAPPTPRPALLSGPLPLAVSGDVALTDLLSFVEHPVRAFLWQRLGVRVPDHEDDLADRLPIELDGLAKWELGERMLAARLTGADPAVLRAAEWRRGTLPPFALGAAVLAEVEHSVDTLVRVCAQDFDTAARAVDVAIDLGNGRRLTGTVADVRGESLVRATFSRLAPKHRLSAWVSVLALAATEDRSWSAVTTGRGQFRRPAWRSRLLAPSAPEAVSLLRELVALRDAGLTEPLPVAPGATAAYAERRFRGGSGEEALAAAQREFDGGPNGPGRFGDHTDRHLRYVWGETPRLDALAALPASAGERGEATRFGAVARRLWAPLLAAETQGQP